MKPLFTLNAPVTTPVAPLFFFTPSPSPSPSPSLPIPRFKNSPHYPISCIYNDASFRSTNPAPPPPDRPRTPYPGGYKRPEIKVPNVLLQLDPEDLLAPATNSNVLHLIDQAVAKFVGIVVLDGAEASGKSVYEAACLLNSVVKDRAYVLISERVDIAAAVNASGVVLSDQGIPAIVARNTMIDSKSESVVLPLVGRTVQTSTAALIASSSEGADFLICSSSEGQGVDVINSSLFDDVKIPIFVVNAPSGEAAMLDEMTKLLKSGASGLVVSLAELKLLTDDVLSQLLDVAYANNGALRDDVNQLTLLESDNSLLGGGRMAGFVNVEDREKQLIETERSVLVEAVNVIQKAAPLMEEVSLLVDAVSQLDEPFLLVIVGEFNSGKSSVINALLGDRYLKEGVVPTTNEITFLRYSDVYSGEQQRCERHPDGQYICYIPLPILKEMSIVDTPGTNVILQRQQRLTEEFVPRADLVLFVISADRPLTESEVAFLRYTQQWKKKVVFVLNKSDLYRSMLELEEAISFVKDNTQKLLNIENVTVYPVSARSALEAKLSAVSGVGKELSINDPHQATNSFDKLENYLYSFLDGSSDTGMQRMKLKLETPIRIAERLLSNCETLLRQDCNKAKQDLTLANKMVDSVKEYDLKIASESITWRRQSLSLIDATKSRVVELIESTLQLTNFDLVASYLLRGENSVKVPATSRIQFDVIGPALSDAQKLLREYLTWLKSNNTHERRLYKEAFENRWPSLVYPKTQVHLDSQELVLKVDEFSLRLIEDLNASATSKLVDQEIREAVVETFGGLGAAGLSASLLTSVLPTTLEDLLALGLCSAGGYIAVANFPVRRRKIIDKVNKFADSLGRELEEAMRKDVSKNVSHLENFVKIIGKPYQDAAQYELDKLLEIQNEVSNVQKKLQLLQIEIQNLHVSSSVTRT